MHKKQYKKLSDISSSCAHILFSFMQHLIIAQIKRET